MKKNKLLTIVADADAIVAQAYPDDLNHLLATNIAEKLSKLGAHILYPSTAILEATTVLQGKLNSGATAYGTAVAFTQPNIKIIGVNQETLKEAVNFFSPTISKKDTLFDCVVATIAKDKKADAIFSFDKFYKKLGFKLASEL